MKNLYSSKLVKSVLFKFPVGFLGSSNPINMLIRKLLTVLTPFCSWLIQIQLLGQTNLQLWCVCVLHNEQLPSMFSFQRNVHFKNVWGINTDLHFVQVSGQERGKRTGILLYFPTPPSWVVRFHALIIFFQGKTSQHILNIKIPDISVSILW